jgi:hypothetical protein
VLVALVAAPGATARFGSGGNASADNPALVSLASVSNGCGGGVASSDARFADEWEFGAWRVNFREACNVHDACYSGTVVADPFASRPGQVVDFRTWSQERCDDAFLANMRTLCRRQISGPSPRVHSQMLDARNDCMFGEGRFQPSCSTFYSVVPQVGGFSKIGALLAYKLVRKCGHQYYRQRADLNGNWVNRGSESSVRTASILQVGRAIAVSWTGGTKLCGLGTGTLISRDQNEEVVGDATVTGFANGDFHGTLRIVVNKDGSITFPSLPLGLAVSDAVPVQPLAMAIGARAPDFVGQVPVNYPNPASASKTFTVPLSESYKEFKDLVVIVGFVSAEVTYTYHRAGS